MGEYDTLFIQSHRICPVCGRAFIVPPENAYRLYIGGKYVDYCRYSCFRSVQVTLKPAQNRGAGRSCKKRVQAEDTI
jgi:hypothetical protein